MTLFSNARVMEWVQAVSSKSIDTKLYVRKSLTFRAVKEAIEVHIRPRNFSECVSPCYACACIEIFSSDKAFVASAEQCGATPFKFCEGLSGYLEYIVTFLLLT